MISLLVSFKKHSNTQYLLMLTGWTSLLVISIVGINLFFNFVIPTNSQTYFLTKDFVTNLVMFVIVPLMLIIRNENMSKYVSQHISTMPYYNILFAIYNKFSAMLLNKRGKNNSVTPLPNVENVVFINDSQTIIHI